MHRVDLNLALYRRLYLIRAAEASIRGTYHLDQMKTPMHMSMGEEAICAGVCHALAPDDQVVGTYRSHGLYLARTGETDRFFAEMYGRHAGMARGKGGSMHLTAPQDGLICTSAIVGTTIPVAVGAAFANRQLGNRRVVAAFFGDGAIDEGVFWESLNAACAMTLPVVFVCEDNGYAVHVPDRVRHGYDSIAEVVSRFRCEVYRDESVDAEAIFDLATRAVEAVRSGGRPAFLHLKYHRHLEHVGVNEDFDQGYRTKAEAERWAQADPVALARARLLEAGAAARVEEIERAVDRQVAGSVRRAAEAPFPPASELHRDVLA